MGYTTGQNMVQGEDVMTRLSGLEVYLPDGRRLGLVHDAVIDENTMQCNVIQ